MKSAAIIEFGDFQTPAALAQQIVGLLASHGVSPASIVEPTCGRGSLLHAAASRFPEASRVLGVDINRDHLADCAALVRDLAAQPSLLHQCFFDTDWPSLLDPLPEPILVIGNPPWVTNAELGVLGAGNLPTKTNATGARGVDAITGSSNFDISEWMLTRLITWLEGRRGTVAMLCKRSVARKVLTSLWRDGRGPAAVDIHPINTERHFGASVQACLLVCRLEPRSSGFEASVHRDLSPSVEPHTIAYRDGALIADLDAYRRWGHLQGNNPVRWRSGVKHDCVRVMELERVGGRFRNGLGEIVDLEPEFVFPMLKSSDVANRRGPRRFMLVPQRRTGDATDTISEKAPKTWRYLTRHGDLLDRRASSVYRNRPRFAVFGVGPYAFAPWKVAISGFYKRLSFTLVGPHESRPVVLDDTSYFLAFDDRARASRVAEMLGSDAARGFFSAFMFRDNKRPVTVRLLNRLSLDALATELTSV